MHFAAMMAASVLPTAAMAASVLPTVGRGGHHVQTTLSWLSAEGDPTPVNASYYNAALLDHFDGSVAYRQKRWSERYYVDDRFWCGDGCPVFLYVGGEGPQGPPSPRLLMWTLAEKHGALMLALEHRFYGESRPTPDMSDASLVYLTSAQALADLARFHEYISSYSCCEPDRLSSPPLKLSASPRNSKWVTFGGSYPGNLATWFKAKYPSLVRGTVGSSAPVYAKYDYDEYAQVVGTALGYPLIGGSDECASTITAGASALAAAMARQPGGGSLPASLRPCAAPNGTADLSTYYANIMGNLQGVSHTRGGSNPSLSFLVLPCMPHAGGPSNPLDSSQPMLPLSANPAFGPRCVGRPSSTISRAVYTYKGCSNSGLIIVDGLLDNPALGRRCVCVGRPALRERRVRGRARRQGGQEESARGAGGGHGPLQ